MIDFDIEKFVRKYMTGREESLLKADFAKFADEMHARIDGKRMLVVGGAGTIGSNYVKAAELAGASRWHIMFRHILPNAAGTIITSAVLLIPGVIFSESMLSYLGIVNLEAENLTSIGTMLANGQECMSTSPHVLLAPAVVISLLMIGFNLIGNGLREATSPNHRGGAR